MISNRLRAWRLPVDPRKWLFAAYLLMTARKGISALQLQHELSVSYPTAWYMLHPAPHGVRRRDAGAAGHGRSR